MQYRTLGCSGVQVSALSLGAMVLGAIGNTDVDECVRIIHNALDAGVNSIDTADVYSKGQSEEIVGRALAGRRDDVVLATKCFWPMGPGRNQRGLSRRWITTAVDASLRRLGTDWIDVLYLHKPDPTTDFAESLTVVSDLIHAGKVRLAGTSSMPASELVEAQWSAERHHLPRPRVEQPAYSLFTRGAEGEIFPTCARHGVGVMVAAPLNGGWLTGKYRNTNLAADASARAARWTHDRSFAPERPATTRKAQLVADLADVAADHALPLAHLALAFALEHPAVTSAIIGPRTLGQLDQLLGAADVRLDPSALDAIDAIVTPGQDVDPADRWYVPAELAVAARRRERRRTSGPTEGGGDGKGGGQAE